MQHNKWAAHAAVVILLFAAAAFGAGQVSVMDPITKLPKYLKGGVGISINGANGTITATGEPAVSPGTTSQYYRGDKTWQTLNQSAVLGLSVNDNPSFAGVTASETLGSNLITNGDFASSLTGWGGTNWGYSGGTALHTPGSTASLLYGSLQSVQGTVYKLTYDVVGMTTGTVAATFGGGGGVALSTNKTRYSLYIVATSVTSLVFVPSSTFDGAIDNVVVQVVSGGTVAAGANFSINSAGDFIGRNINANSGDISPTVTLTSSVDSAGQSATFIGRKSRGSISSPAATQASDNLAVISGIGHSGLAWLTASGVIQITAAEVFTPTAKGTYLTFLTTATGTTTRSEKVRITGDGALCVDSTACSGAGVVQAKQFQETVYAPAAGSTFTVDLANGSDQEFTTNNNTTITLPPPVAGKSYTITVKYGGVHTVAFTGGGTIKWSGGAAPAATSVNGKYDIYGCKSDATSTYTFCWDGGRNY